MHGCVTTRGRGRQGDIWATAKTLVVAPSMPGINIYVLGVYNPGFFFIRNWVGGRRGLSVEVHWGGRREDIARRKKGYIYIAGIFLYDIVLLNITAAQVKYSIDKTEY